MQLRGVHLCTSVGSKSAGGDGSWERKASALWTSLRVEGVPGGWVHEYTDIMWASVMSSGNGSSSRTFCAFFITDIFPHGCWLVGHAVGMHGSSRMDKSSWSF